MSQEYFQSMPVFEIPEDSTAAILRHTITSDGVADDLSSASGDKLFYATDEDGVAVVSAIASAFFTDGSDGKVQVQMSAATAVVTNGPRDLICEFEIQGFNGGNLVTKPFILRVTKRAKV